MAPAQIICIWIPRFALTAATRAQSPGAKPPGALYDALARGQPLVECRADLEAQGLAPGLPLREAQARWPAEPLLPRDPAAAARAFEPVLRALDTFSPFVENAAPGLAYLDAAGLDRLHGPPAELGAVVRAAVLRATGFTSAVGVAASKFIAAIAARTAAASGVCVAPPGRAAAALAGLPVSALGLDAATGLRLRALGVRTVEQFARLPAASILHRYGDAGARAYRGLHGTLQEPLRARDHPLALHATLDFEWVEHNPDRLQFACKILTDRLAQQLVRQHVACRALVVGWIFEDGPPQQRTLRLAEPSARAATLLRYLRWHLDGLQVASGIVGVRLRASELTSLAGWPLKLLSGAGARAPDAARRLRAHDVLGRLRARWGDAVVRQAELIDARRPERAFRWCDPTLPEPDGAPPSAPQVMPPLWLLDPPQPVRVVDEATAALATGVPLNAPTPPSPWKAASIQQIATVGLPPLPPGEGWGEGFPPPLPWGEGRGDGVLSLRPVRAGDDHPADGRRGGGEGPPPLPRGEGGSRAAPRRLLVLAGQGHVVAAQAGPWRLHDTPWRADAAERDYFQFESARGPAFLCFRDRPTGQWYLQGVYD